MWKLLRRHLAAVVSFLQLAKQAAEQRKASQDDESSAPTDWATLTDPDEANRAAEDSAAQAADQKLKAQRVLARNVYLDRKPTGDPEHPEEPVPLATAAFLYINQTREGSQRERQFLYYHAAEELGNGKLPIMGRLEAREMDRRRLQALDNNTRVLDRDTAWECCGCSATNSRFEFLCSVCKAHSKCSCCEPVAGNLCE
ncbi:hypothetical protein B0T19DRAFT_395887 [Cercophora scortea]|uniref:RanBP2-type domain-containing protein n=1 Tax=Cercophora scortea TaxID=314031 RepID=A0AAE0MKM7_9PEZI|nr:hypothetical protein B0T19DRAFT_395887 [Cercophora scortea]